MFGPYGVGVVFGNKNLLEVLYPYLGGGSMIEDVTFEKTTFTSIPLRFEGGTPPIADVISLEPALSFLEKVRDTILEPYDKYLVDYAMEKINELGFVKVVGNPTKRSGVISFTVEGAHPYDIGVLLNKMGIAIRVGHHCAIPLHRRLGINASARISFAIYNTTDEIDYFISSMKKIKKLL